MLCFEVSSRMFLVRSSSALIVHCTKNASNSMLCPSIVTEPECTRDREASSSFCASQIQSRDGDLLQFTLCQHHLWPSQCFLGTTTRNNFKIRCWNQNYSGCWLAQDLACDCHCVTTHEYTHTYNVDTYTNEYKTTRHVRVMRSLSLVSKHVSSTCKIALAMNTALLVF